MFDTLSDNLNSVFDRLRGRGALSEQDVRDAMREVRVALLEADVALPVARDFISKVTEKAVGAQVLKSVKPGQQVVKIVNDELVAMLGGEEEQGEATPLNLDVRPPAVVMMVGLQGSGKTTSTAKIAKLLKEKHGKKAMMASLDVNRAPRSTSRRCRSSRASSRLISPAARSKPRSCRTSMCCCSIQRVACTWTRR